MPAARHDTICVTPGGCKRACRLTPAPTRTGGVPPHQLRGDSWASHRRCASGRGEGGGRQATRRQKLVGALPVGGGGVHGKDVQQQARAGRHAEAADAHVAQCLAHHERRDTVQPLRLLRVRARVRRARAGGARGEEAVRSRVRGGHGGLPGAVRARPIACARCSPASLCGRLEPQRRHTPSDRAHHLRSAGPARMRAARHGPRAPLLMDRGPRGTQHERRRLLSPRPTWS